MLPLPSFEFDDKILMQGAGATPQGECRWITHSTSGRAACTAPWMAKPLGLTFAAEPSTTRPSRSTFTRLDAVTS